METTRSIVSHCFCDDCGKFKGGLDPASGPMLHDPSGNSSRCMLLAQLGKDFGQQRFGRAINQICRGPSGPAHPHIEWTVPAQRKAAFRRIKLHGRHAEIKDDALQGSNLAYFRNFIKLTKTAVNKMKDVVESLLGDMSAPARLRITINPEYLRRARGTER